MMVRPGYACAFWIALLHVLAAAAWGNEKPLVHRKPAAPHGTSAVAEAEELGMAEAIAREEADRRDRREGASADGGAAGWFSLERLFGRKPRRESAGEKPPIGPGAVGEAAALPAAAPSPVPAPADAAAEDGGRELSDMLLADARKLFDAGDPEGALAVLDALVRRAPDLPEAWGTRAKLLLSRREYARAADDYRRVLSLEEGDIEAHYGLGTALEKMAERAEAEGDAGVAGERYRDAALEYKAVLWKRPDYPPACYSLGCVYARMGKRDDALHYFRKTLERVEKDSEMARRARYNMKLLGEY